MAACSIVVACAAEVENQPHADSDPRPGVLVIGLSDGPSHLNPGITTQGGVHTASRLLYNGLVGLGPRLEPLPELAESWEIAEDGRRYVFHLRKDVVWHDGRPFTAADVKFSFEEILLRYHSRARASLGTVLESIQMPTPHTVEFRFREPYAPLLQQLNLHEAVILPRHVFEGTDPLTNPANLAPVGTGPFRFVSYKPDVEIVYEANPDYFERGLPRLGRIVMRIVPDRGNQVLALEAGEVDWLFGAPGLEIPRLANRGFGMIRDAMNPGGTNCIMTLSFNLDRPALQDVRLRRAIAHAVDRRQMLERILFGEGRVARAPISSGISFAHASGLDLPEHDLEAAAQLLDEAGWKELGNEASVRRSTGVRGVADGTPLRIEFLHFPTYTSYAQLLRAQLAEVGIEFVSRPLEPAVFVEAVFARRAFDMNIVSYCNSTDPEIGVRRMYVTSNIAPIPFSNSSGYRNPTVDSLFDRARTLLDQSARTETYRSLQEILAEELPYIWLVETTSTWVHAPRCSGFVGYGHWAKSAVCG